MSIPKYCNKCRLIFGEVAVHQSSLTCPVSVCKNRLIKINADMVDIIQTLNRKNYPIINASLENNSIYIIFDRKCRFKSLPKSFDMKGIENEGEYSVLVSYSEPNPSKTAEELKMIANDIFEWVKSL